jgi:Caspase domain
MGINVYTSPKIDNLQGAVKDALNVKDYLEKYLGVPTSQIRLLLDAEATRSAIIGAFNDLIADQRIHRGSPILIYYAGHGGEADAPKNWEAGDAKIQMLIPHDFHADINGQVIYGIPDRTIGTLLSRVAEKWGDNIVCLPCFTMYSQLMALYIQTVIFDCCHSASGTRAVSASNRIPRSAAIPNDVASDLDVDIWSNTQFEKSGVAIAPGFLHHGLKSHILLAACGRNELAYEEQGNGVFTNALLKLLSTIGAQNVTYANLLQRLPRLTG